MYCLFFLCLFIIYECQYMFIQYFISFSMVQFILFYYNYYFVSQVEEFFVVGGGGFILFLFLNFYFIEEKIGVQRGQVSSLQVQSYCGQEVDLRLDLDIRFLVCCFLKRRGFFFMLYFLYFRYFYVNGVGLRCIK